MLQALIKDGLNVRVRQAVKDGFAFSTVFDQTGLLEYAQLMGNGGLAHAQHIGDVADAQFAFKQRAENFNAGAVAENFEQFGNVV